jgi:thymidine phosphorylase
MIEFDPDVRGGDGYRIARDILESGRALAKMNAIIDAQGRRAMPLAVGGLSFDVVAPIGGVVIGVDNLRLARIARLSGAPQVPGAGIDLRVKFGDPVQAGQSLYRVHAQFEADLEFARRMAHDGSGYAVGMAGEMPRADVTASGDIQ